MMGEKDESCSWGRFLELGFWLLLPKTITF
jgi:hypothetical protein